MKRNMLASISKRKLGQCACNAAVLLQFTAFTMICMSDAANAESIDLPAGKSEYRYNQANGNSSSVAVGITSSFGVNSSAQASPGYNASSSASLVLNTDPSGTQSGLQNLPYYNSSIQAVGSEASNSPVNVKITSQTLQVESTNGSSSKEATETKQLINASNFSDSGNSTSNAEFSAEGFGAIQDLRFRGGDAENQAAGSQFKADVVPILNTDNDGNVKSISTYSTGTANANAESRTRFQADITTSTFVNAFVSSF